MSLRTQPAEKTSAAAQYLSVTNREIGEITECNLSQMDAKLISCIGSFIGDVCL
jgi:hypothetical protein